MQADMQGTNNYPVIFSIELAFTLDLNREGDIKDIIEDGKEFTA